MTSGTSYSPPPAFGRFKLLHQIGAGVLGPVFRTHDPDHERLVAVKAFTIDLTPEQAAALAAELTHLAALGIDAPYLAAPIAAGIEELVPYLAAPHVSGESLDAAIRQYGPAPAGDAMRLITHVAEALDAASHAGVHHGSLHPRDIIVTPGDTHVTGLGVAQALGRVGLHGPIRRPYVAPEREGGDEWGASADIYALAAIAYEVLTGRRALPGTEQPLPGLADIQVHDAAALREIIEAAFDPDPGRRPARARDFAAAFAAALAEGSAGAAAGERAADRRPRKPRTRPHKLPGLDEPLAAAEAVSKPKTKTPGPAVVAPMQDGNSAPAPEPAPVEPPLEARDAGALAAVPPEPGPEAQPAGEIRYVPVSDPADAGGSAADIAALTPSMPERALDSGRSGAPPVSDVTAAKLATGLTPDLRLADELLGRGEGAGESIDAELAAALDRMASHQGAGPTPALIGLDILGPGPADKQAIEDVASGGIDFALAANAPITRRVLELPELMTGPTPSEIASLTPAAPEPTPPLSLAELRATAGGEPAGPRSSADEFSLAFDDVPGTPAAAAPARDREPDLAAVDASLPPLEPPKPFVRGRGGERRRPQSRYSRIDLTPPPGDDDAGSESAVPRAFDSARNTPPQRSTPDFELLTRPAPARSAALPLAAGVALGLIVGLAGGYWLGSRSVPAGAPAPAPVATAARVPAPTQSPAGRAGSAPAEAAPSLPAPPASRPEPTSPAAPAPEKPARPSSGPTRGSIQVAASLQANVYLDGERRGLTPRSLTRVPLGSHVIRITRPGYQTQEQTVVLTAEEPSAALSFTLRRGSDRPAPSGQPPAPGFRSVLTVSIDSIPPGARIRIDGRDLAPTPLTVRQLRPGTHTLEVRLPGYKTWTQKITVAAGDERRITATLERDTTR